MISRNIKIFYVLEALLSLFGGIILPVYVVYFRHYGITLFQVAVLAAVFETTIIVFELPTGHFADRFGRKLSTAIGFLLFALSGSIFIFFRSFGGFLIAEIIFGLAETFISGALEALAVDSIEQQQRPSYLPRLFANRTVFRTSALLLGMISGGFLASKELSLLFYPFTAIAVIGFVTALFLTESGLSEKADTPGESREKPASLRQAIFGHRAVLALFAVGLLANFAYEPADQFWQVLFSEIKDLPVSLFGILTAAGLGVVALSAGFTKKLYSKLSLYLSGCFLLMAAGIFGAVQLNLYPAVAGIVIYFIMKELVRPAVSTHLNQLFESANRAAYLSSFNLTCSIGEVAAGIIAGILAQQFSVVFVFYVAAVSALIVPFVYRICAGRR